MVDIQLNSYYHESRQNTHQTEEQQVPDENSPLLQRFPQNNAPAGRSTLSTATISLLLIVLLSGVVIGIYLLVIQSNSENVLPPVEMPLQLVSRSQWESVTKPLSSLVLSPMKTSHVVVMQTDTDQCYNLGACTSLLNDMQMTSISEQNSLPYNFLVSSNGQTFEALGWSQHSPLFPEYSPTPLVLAFIGNFTEVSPSRAQLNEAKDFFAVSVSLQYLDPSFLVIGRRTRFTPKYLFESLMSLPQWDSKLSDM